MIPNGKARAAIGDVAALAGVSLGTVSNVLNHPDRVSATTREKVERAMTMLDYEPNRLARSLAAGASPTLGLVVTDLTNSLFIDIARGAERVADRSELAVLLANSDGRLEREARHLRMFAQTRVAGILMTLNDAAHFAAIARLAPTSVPVVMLNFDAPTTQFCSVSVDNHLGGAIATRHLLDLGRRRIVFVGGPGILRPVQDRAAGFHQVMREAGVEPVAEIAPNGVNRADGWRVGRELVPAIRRGEVDGIVAASDLLAAGVVQAVTSAGDLSIPDHVAIVGYDNNQAAWDSPIPITTVSQPGERIGELGAQIALGGCGADHDHRSHVLEPALVVRQTTTGAAPAPMH
ncbi:LacI family DNA-binding transcriptional regulator [Cellulomonas fimi]|uniref:Transcriptional regulator, LacI family n=1 Tax=Cellulomonas fimi (strain ATCC 484 / DSM 20113 / JCM 1341 / CCUG 24087 / LMG 16345 / NBRC 15513 / NCIMB 8980 / NCTC 7547 / NRS-133) TaxID=590998 RepID=F4GYH8_CELFA|nr:LacI family DNA-binding transcriptional regulator [Cellulomonas fimi]AEE47095.1 transcriptional regulator, LacI family [Cellulomonas fimi ATCC 484]NNH07334.1 LacI family transcriptional regulator [Cellulomonas fimi]VEH35231.1 Degradation activator [Cellulomonas fimi]